ncbi:MAG: hypothetical protein N3B16_03415 [Candidatus Aminicenantes bacterium]|nr:hypothetical protein [Candidatus Aminicenantes bacterium]
MKGLKIFWGVISLILGWMVIYAEISLDEVIQAGRFVFYRDHADPHKYYYVPDAPRLATKPDGTPEFTLIKYTKVGGETQGGILHFLVTWGYSESELNAAQSMLRLRDPQAVIAGPVPFKEGVFSVVSSTAGEGGLFTRKIVGQGKAPILPGQKAAVSIALTAEGASLLWESFKNPTSDVSVMFSLRFTGLTPSFQAKLKVNWDKVYTHHDVKLHAEGTIKIVKLEADVKAILDDLRQKGAIQLEVAGEDVNMQKMLDVVYAHLIAMMCDKIPITPEEAGSGAKRNPRENIFPLMPNPGPLFNSLWPEDYSSPWENLEGRGPLANLRFNEEATPKSESNPQSQKRAEEMRRRAEKLVQERKFKEAIDIYKNAYNLYKDPLFLYEIATVYLVTYNYKNALSYYLKFLQSTQESYSPEIFAAAQIINNIYLARPVLSSAKDFYKIALEKVIEGNIQEAISNFQRAKEAFLESYKLTPHPFIKYNAALCCNKIGRISEDLTKKRENYELAILYFKESIEKMSEWPENKEFVETIKEANVHIMELREKLADLAAGKAIVEATGKTAEEIAKSKEIAVEEIETVEVTNEQKNLVNQIMAKQQAEKEGQLKETKEQVTTSGEKESKPSEIKTRTTQAVEGTKEEKAKTEEAKAEEAKSKAKVEAKEKETTTTKAKQEDQTKPKVEALTEKKPESKPSGEVKPIVTVQLGYTFKRIKLSGNYEVDLRKRLREDRDIVMSGNISGIFQKYGEDKRFFTIVSLDDPAFQERSIEVILDGQDASDFKNYINSVSVLFRKQRFSGPPVTGEVKFFEEQFNRTGNRLTFKYSRLGEASTEWLDYEYKPKWSFYGGIEWEGEWVKTSDSVITLTPPVRRRNIQITVDEDNIIRNNVRALAIQIKHRIFGQEILKEVIIDYYKGDPLEAEYTYLHEDRNLNYSYRVIWLFQDGREIQTNWVSKESPFIYAIYPGR